MRRTWHIEGTGAAANRWELVARMGYSVLGRPAAEGTPEPLVRVIQVTPGALEALGVDCASPRDSRCSTTCGTRAARPATPTKPKSC